MTPVSTGSERWSKRVTVIHLAGTDDEERHEVSAVIQPESGTFPVDTPVYPGDIVEFPDPRGGRSQNLVADVKIHEVGTPRMHHIEVEWGAAPQVRTAAVRRLGIEGLHPEVIDPANDLFTDGHYAEAIFAAAKALDRRVSSQSGIDDSGRTLMTEAFKSASPAIDVSVESGQSGRDEQEGFRFIFMGVAQGIRNPKGHENVRQDDPQRALEYLALISVLFRRLDDAQASL